MKTPKIFKVITHRRGNERGTVGTIAELTEAFSYTLECGASYAHEKGNKKINLAPKSMNTLVKNINNAHNNSAADGWGENSYSIGIVTSEEAKEWLSEHPEVA